jgi:hypothetical protein
MGVPNLAEIAIPITNAWCRVTVGSHVEYDSLRTELLDCAVGEAIRASLSREVAVFACGMLTDGYYQFYFSPRARIVFDALLQGRRAVACPALAQARPASQFIIGDSQVFEPA